MKVVNARCLVQYWQKFSSFFIFCFLRLKSREISCKYEKLGKYFSYCTRRRTITTRYHIVRNPGYYLITVPCNQRCFSCVLVQLLSLVGHNSLKNGLARRKVLFQVFPYLLSSSFAQFFLSLFQWLSKVLYERCTIASCIFSCLSFLSRLSHRKTSNFDMRFLKFIYTCHLCFI